MSQDPHTEQLLALALAGDESAREKLLTRHTQRLRKMISAFLDPRVSARVDASDVLQDALTLASVKLPQYLRERPIAFYPWLRQIVQEQMITAHRRHIHAERRSVDRENPFQVALSQASADELADHLVSSESTPSNKARREETREMIKSALGELSSRDREILVMRFVEQLQVAEIADVLAISESSAKSRVRRALEKLNRSLGDGLA